MFWSLYSVAFWLYLALTSILLFPGALGLWAVTAPFDPRKVLLHRYTCFWASLYTWLSPAWPVEVVGREKIDDRRTYVMVANHQSLVDIFVLFRLFRHFKWVSKIENFSLPCIGWNMALNGYIKLRRGDRESVVRMLQTCRDTLSQGSSIMMFPEGTRSRTRDMRPFKPGAFELAIDAEVPIVPIVVEGSSEALPKKGWVIRGRHPIRVEVLDPIEPALFAGKTPLELADTVRDLIAGRLGELRAGATGDLGAARAS